jgi:hypothetical protein
MFLDDSAFEEIGEGNRNTSKYKAIDGIKNILNFLKFDF